jgi:hypothetical protein
MSQPPPESGNVVDPQVLAARRARRAEVSEDASLELRLFEAERRLGEVAAERDALRAQIAGFERDLRGSRQREWAEQQQRLEAQGETASAREVLGSQLALARERLAEAEAELAVVAVERDRARTAVEDERLRTTAERERREALEREGALLRAELARRGELNVAAGEAVAAARRELASASSADVASVEARIAAERQEFAVRVVAVEAAVAAVRERLGAAARVLRERLEAERSARATAEAERDAALEARVAADDAADGARRRAGSAAAERDALAAQLERRVAVETQLRGELEAVTGELTTLRAGESDRVARITARVESVVALATGLRRDAAVETSEQDALSASLAAMQARVLELQAGLAETAGLRVELDAERAARWAAETELDAERRRGLAERAARASAETRLSALEAELASLRAAGRPDPAALASLRDALSQLRPAPGGQPAPAPSLGIDLAAAAARLRAASAAAEAAATPPSGIPPFAGGRPATTDVTPAPAEAHAPAVEASPAADFEPPAAAGDVAPLADESRADDLAAPAVAEPVADFPPPADESRADDFAAPAVDAPAADVAPLAVEPPAVELAATAEPVADTPPIAGDLSANEIAPSPDPLADVAEPAVAWAAAEADDDLADLSSVAILPGARQPLPARPPIAVPGPWLRDALRSLAADEPEIAELLVVALLPAQAGLARKPLAYELAVAGGTTHRVVLDEERVRVELPRAGAIDARVSGSLEALVPLVAGGAGRRLPGTRVEGRRQLRRLIKARRAPLGLAQLADAGITPSPGLLLSVLARAVDPQWTMRALDAPLTVDIASAGSDRWRVVANGFGALQILPADDAQPARAVLHTSANRLPAVLAGTAAPEDASVEGDLRDVQLLLSWLDRAQRHER